MNMFDIRVKSGISVVTLGSISILTASVIKNVPDFFPSDIVPVFFKLLLLSGASIMLAGLFQILLAFFGAKPKKNGFWFYLTVGIYDILLVGGILFFIISILYMWIQFL